MSGPKIAVFDIETAPAVADVWSLWDNNVSLNQMHMPTRVISFAWKWHGNPRVEFRSEYHDGFEPMIQRAWQLIDEADIIVHFNGTRFDYPHLKREFLLLKLTPPSPVMQIDLMKVVKSEFRFISNKLEHISTQLGHAGKVKHSGHTLWADCLRPGVDEDTRRKAWAQMRKYNKGDVTETENVYDDIRPWIKNHPSMALFTDDPLGKCPNCGSDDLVKRGFAYTTASAFQRYRCNNCGTWPRDARSVARTDIRSTQ